MPSANLSDLTDHQASTDHQGSTDLVGDCCTREPGRERSGRVKEAEREGLIESEKLALESQPPLAGCVTPGKSLSLSELHCLQPVKSDYL